MYKKPKKVKLINTDILATMNLYENDVCNDAGIIIHKKHDMQDIQEVLEVSEYAANRGIKVGDMIHVDLTKYIMYKPAHNYDSAQSRTLAPDGKKMDEIFNPPYIKIDGTVFFHPDYSDVDYIVTEWDDVEESTLILPEEKTLIV